MRVAEWRSPRSFMTSANWLNAPVFLRLIPRWRSIASFTAPIIGPRRGGWFSHLHAAATAMAIDSVERRFPRLVDADPAPFAPRHEAGSNRDATDSLINAAAAHHKPATFLQWCVASADRIASGFEREEFEEYNRSRDRNHIQARLLVPFEEYRGEQGAVRARTEQELVWRYPLAMLSPRSMFPTREPGSTVADAQKQYRAVWDAFVGGLDLIPPSHREAWSLWLDHFDSLWLTVAHAIPAATAYNIRPEVSLYDHSKTTAALAVALWRFHAEGDDEPEAVAAAQRQRADWDDRKFLLVQGDFCGIQDFIFGAAAQTQKWAAKLLRGRSAMVALLTELASLRLLDELALPPTSQIINAAGKFLIVAPNTAAVREKLSAVRRQLDDWFLDHGQGLASIALAWTAASSNQFVSDFAGLRDELAGALEIAKRQRFGLCGANAAAPLREVDYPNGVCQLDGRLPGTLEADDGIWVHPFSDDQRLLGEQLADPDVSRLLVFDSAADLPSGSRLLATDFFGYRVLLTQDEAGTGKFGAFAASGALRRAFDLSLPTADPDAPLWNGYARRPVNAYVPLFVEGDEASPRYARIAERAVPGSLKTFEHLASDDREAGRGGKLVGVEALGVLKGDVDNLGLLFQASLGNKPTFAKWAALSRRMNAFFSIWVPWRCRAEPEYHSIYTVFSGGDDFFFLGPWYSVKRFALILARDFSRYCAENPSLHFSAGYLMVKPGYPLRLLSEHAETALAHAKKNPVRRDSPGKCAIHLDGETIPWAEYPSLLERTADLGRLVKRYSLSTGYLYDALMLSEMAESADRRPENARWRSLLQYRTRRDVAERQRKRGAEAETAVTEIVGEVGERGIAQLGRRYRIVLSDHLYRLRST